MKPVAVALDVEWFDPDDGGAIVRFGFVGRSTIQGHSRLYLDPELSSYLEFREDEVLHVSKLNTQNPRLALSAIWFKSDAKLREVSLRVMRGQARFVAGPITDQFLRSAKMIPPVGFATATIVQTIISVLVGCPSQRCTAETCAQDCATVVGPCPTIACNR